MQYLTFNFFQKTSLVSNNKILMKETDIIALLKLYGIL
jgi:hypothetical protein